METELLKAQTLDLNKKNLLKQNSNIIEFPLYRIEGLYQQSGQKSHGS